ncbi:MAG: NADH-quinone oxidoreductase subunit K [Chloroflexota bacterium]|nr:NADH-quinone oxidoreductase subunit K [Chloroflexota bacterium]
MTFYLSLVIAVLFGSGAYLMLKSDLLRVVVGMLLVSNAANLFIMSTGLTHGRAPIYPLEEGESVFDPLVQSMTLTAIVISFAVAALALSLVRRVYATHLSVNLDNLSEAEALEEAETEREREIAA